MMDEERIRSGSRNGYRWLTSTAGYGGTMPRLCPEVFIDRYVAVTSVDSGVLRVTREQQEEGWEERLGIGYSPRLQSLSEMPHQRDGLDVIGYDEFYVFETRRDLGERSIGNVFTEEHAPAPGRVVVFVNWLSFVLHDQDPAAQDLNDLFWRQLAIINPESYIADGNECLTFVSRNAALFENVFARLSSML